MFFMMGITSGRKDFQFQQMMICQACGSYGRYMVYMTYTVLSLFFIPVFKWNKHYYVETSCCHTTYELDPEVGKMIAGGQQTQIRPENLWKIRNASYPKIRRCSSCGYTTTENFTYCPKCGSRF